MKSSKRYVSIILVTLFILLSLSGCYDRREVDDMAYPIAVGLDKGEGNFLRMTLQIAVPTAIGGGGEGGGGGGGEKSVSVTTVETPTIYSGLNMVNTYVSKQIDLSHVKAMVFSEELAREGIEKYIHAIIRGREFRPNAYILVARGEGGTAEEFIRSVTPKLEANPAKYYEMVLSAYRYTSFTANTQLVDFYHKMESHSVQPIAVLADVGKFESTEDINIEASTYKEKGRSLPLEGDFKAGDMPKIGDFKAETMGLAVFDGSKMVGELDGEETTYHLMVDGKFGYAYVTIPDPQSKDNFVLLNIKQNRPPKKKVEMVNGKPRINVKVALEADILSIQSGINYEDTDKTTILENAAEEFLKEGIERMLKKTAEEFRSDTLGFGNVMKSKFLTWDQWKDFNWNRKYRDSSFQVSLDLRIRRPGLIIRTLPAVGSEGEEK